MAFINDGTREQLELLEKSSPILVDGEVFKVVYDYIFGKAKDYLPKINSKTLRPLLQKAKWLVRCSNLDNLELPISIQRVNLEEKVISAILQFPFSGCPEDGEFVLKLLRNAISFKEGEIKGHGIFFKVPIPPDFPIMEISNGNNGRRRYIKK